MDKSSSVRMGLTPPSAPGEVLEAGLERADDGGKSAQQGDKSRSGDGARAHGTYVSGP